MKFDIDNQTLKDLEIFDTVKNGKSVFDIFSKTRSYGAKMKLREYFSSPLTTEREINERKNAILFFQTFAGRGGLYIDKNFIDFIEYYLNQGDYPTIPPTRFLAFERKIRNKLKPSNDYYIVERGVEYMLELIDEIHCFSLQLAEQECPNLIKRNNEEVFNILKIREFSSALKLKQQMKLKAKQTQKRQVIKSFDIQHLDYIFRYAYKNQIKFFLELIYDYDIFITAAKIAEKYNFSYAEVSEKEEGISIEGLFHPFIENPVQNDITIVSAKNMLFLSGPNMAGKSTFMKALGVAVYLAHIGMPVPAGKMRLNPLSGLATTINISDSLNIGYSHFYSEVQRIKEVANKLKTNKMLVIFDELFRGTNVKDAHEGTLAVINAFLNVRNSFFAVSTHIVEAIMVLASREKIDFQYFEVTRHNNFPNYTYRLKSGISEERLGMYILEKEGVLDAINEIDN